MKQALLASILFLIVSPASPQPASPVPQLPIAGTGSGGAHGPSPLNALVAVPYGKAIRSRRLPDNELPFKIPSAEIPANSTRVRSQDASVDESTLAFRAIQGPAAEGAATAANSTVNSSFTSYSDTDIAGSSDGTYIFYYAYYANEITIYNMSGGVVQQTTGEAFWCDGTSPLPICSLGGIGVDVRVKYDTGAGRWIVTALWLFGSNSVPTNVIAVSRTSDPTQGWYRYQFPACGAFDDWDGSDQPHTGFNNQWIAVASTCSAHNGVNGAGLAVFDKNNLYQGGSLSLQINWWEFVDPYSGGPYSGIGGGNGTRDDPVVTYASTINNREYLTVRLPAPQATVVYSYIEGPVNNPVFYSAAQTVTTSFAVDSIVSAVDAPGCTGCMNALANGWIHSSGVYLFANGMPYILTTMVMGDPNHARATQIINIALNTQTGAATALQVAGGTDGSGSLASEIAMPLVRSSTANQALIIYDHSQSNFYPGVKSIWWNVDTNSVSSSATLQEGSLTPNNWTQSRWVDFNDAIAPISGSTSLVIGGIVAAPSPGESQRATYWTTLALFNDTTAPACTLSGSHVDPHGRTYIEIAVQDQGSGLNTIEVVQQDNADVQWPGYSPGSTDAIVVRATKVNQSLGSRVGLKVTDLAGNSTACDPILTEITRTAGQPTAETFTLIPSTESVITIYNGSPGLRNLEVRMNGRKFKLSGLKDGETRSLDVSDAMVPGDRNVLDLEGKGGRPGASAAVLVWDGHGVP
ncbi:MAG: hypothetical protein QOF89_1943 [Acidobacteriota bacterium]|jgi:hypothetical protein|nr:hypothetical protein [Acidobacteriota bacterium]